MTIRQGIERDEITTARVVRIQDLTPSLRRLTLKGEGFERFDTLSDLHVRLHLPNAGQGGATIPATWPNLRAYTVRSVDNRAAELDIDFVLHGRAGPGTSFAIDARPGWTLGISGPFGGAVADAGEYLFCGDETALPAIARIFENLPADAKGRALIEIPQRSDEVSIARPRGVTLDWLHRGSARPGSALLDAYRRLETPDVSQLFVWAACELQAYREIRDSIRTTLRLPPSRYNAMAYWRTG